MTNPSPVWRTRKISHAENLRHEIEAQTKIVHEKEIEVAHLKQLLKDVEASDLPILLYACCYKDDDSGRLDFDYLYYLPDLKTTKLDRTTRCLYFKDESFLRQNALDLRSVFKNCGFPDSITSFAPDFWSLRQDNQPKVNKAVSNLESVIDHLFAYETIESWQHLRDRLTAYYLPQKKGVAPCLTF